MILNYIKTKILILGAFIILPLISFAQTTPPTGTTAPVTDFKSLIQLFISLLNSVIPLLIGLGLVAFLYGVVRYVTAGSSEETMKEGRNLMIYGIIALFVMVSVWGLVGILVSSFFGGTIAIPQLK